MQARVSYRAERGALGVEFQQDGQYSGMEYQPRTLLSKASVMIEAGYRDGCGRTGYLGFIQGETRTQDDAMIAFNKAKIIAWNGYQFTDDTGNAIQSIEEVFIIGKTMLGVGFQYGEVMVTEKVSQSA